MIESRKACLPSLFGPAFYLPQSGPSSLSITSSFSSERDNPFGFLKAVGAYNYHEVSDIDCAVLCRIGICDIKSTEI
jgi:hypothetical protein